MTVNDVVQIGREALYLIIETSAPILLISMVIGLIVSIFQTVTSIQEPTLTFVPKIIAVFVGIMIFGYWMLNTMAAYMAKLWNNFSVYIR